MLLHTLLLFKQLVQQCVLKEWAGIREGIKVSLAEQKFAKAGGIYFLLALGDLRTRTLLGVTCIMMTASSQQVTPVTPGTHKIDCC